MPKKKILQSRFAVVASMFNSHITDRLLSACLAELASLGMKEKQVEVARVPGAFEIPLTAVKFAERKDIACVICLGAIVRGQTLHYELVAAECARGVQEAALKTGKPVIFEVLAADTMALCEARAREGDSDNKGASAARDAVQMVQLLKKI